MKKKGFFITFEGGDACGKTTQIKLLKDYLNANYPNQAVFVKEPGGTDLGEKIRNLLLHDQSVHMCGRAELLLFVASRVELYEEVIQKALNDGKIVVADRYYDSTIAYQGEARGIMSKLEILNMNRKLLDGLTPNLTFYLKLSPEDAFKRINDREEDKIESEGLLFHERVAKGYNYIARKEHSRFCIIDARESIEKIHEQIVCTIEKKLKKRNG